MKLEKAFYLTIPIFVILIFTSFSCENKKIKQPVQKYDLSDLAKQIIFNSKESQDPQSALKYIHSIHGNSLSGEKSVLHGLSHIYQGEVYEVVATILSNMQLDLYHKSFDPDHGTKFPIIKKNDIIDIKDELFFWMGIDAYAVYGKKGGDALMASTGSDPFYNLKQNVIQSHKVSSDHYSSQIMMGINNDIIGVDKMPILKDIIAAGKLFKNQEYEKVLSFLDKKKLYNKNYFVGHKHVQYYTSSIYKLAALSHYKLGMKAFETGIENTFTTQDSTMYKLIAAMNLGQKYHYFKEDDKLFSFWVNIEKLFISNEKILRLLVESKKIKMPYSLDWVLFENAVLSVIKKPLPKSLQLLNDGSDYILRTMKNMINKKSNGVTQNELHSVLKAFKKDPKIMNNYPTLMSGFISALNLSDFAIKDKILIQDITENMVFTVEYSKGSWQRNRPAFLLSLYGTLRWQGGLLPSCNGFLHDLRILDNRLGALHEISALFTLTIIKGVGKNV